MPKRHLAFIDPVLLARLRRKSGFKAITARLRTRLQAMQSAGSGRAPKKSLKADGDHELVVASYNIHKCVGTDGRFDPARVAEVIAQLDADVVAVQEADKRFGRRHGLLAWVAATHAVLTGCSNDERDSLFWKNADRIWKLGLSA